MVLRMISEPGLGTAASKHFGLGRDVLALNLRELLTRDCTSVYPSCI